MSTDKHTQTPIVKPDDLDVGQAREQIDLLVRGGSLAIRCLDERKVLPAAEYRDEFGNLDAILEDVTRDVSAGKAAYLVVNEHGPVPSDQGGVRDEDIVLTRAFFIDADKPVTRPWHLPPTFILSRDAEHQQVFWVLNDPTAIEPGKFTEAQKRLQAYYGTDGVSNPARIMRLAGGPHRKAETTRYVFTLRGGPRHPTWKILAGIPELPPAPERVKKEKTGTAVASWRIKLDLPKISPERRRTECGGDGSPGWFPILVSLSRTRCDDPEFDLEDFARRWFNGEFNPDANVSGFYRTDEEFDAAWNLKDGDIGPGTWLALVPKQEKTNMENNAEKPPVSTEPLLIRKSGLDLFTTPATPREWALQDWIPADDLTLLQGSGGLNKNRLMHQIGLAIASGSKLWSTTPAQRRYIAVFYEDDENEMRIRTQAARDHLDLPATDFDHFDMTSVMEPFWIIRDKPKQLLAEDGTVLGETTVEVTEIGREFEALLRSTKDKKFVLMDNDVAEFMGAAENFRQPVRKFVRHLRVLCRQTNTTMVMLLHISHGGAARQDLTGGSPAWENVVRNRLTISPAVYAKPDGNRRKQTTQADIIPDQFDLKIAKRNFGGRSSLRLKYHRGVMVPTDYQGPVRAPGHVLSLVEQERRAARLKLCVQFVIDNPGFRVTRRAADATGIVWAMPLITMGLANAGLWSPADGTMAYDDLLDLLGEAEHQSPPPIEYQLRYGRYSAGFVKAGTAKHKPAEEPPF